MMEARKTIVIIIFILLCMVPIFISVMDFFQHNLSKHPRSQNESTIKENKSKFKNADYYLIKGNNPFLHLNASNIIIDNIKKVVSFLSPQGKVYTKSQEPVYYQGNEGFYKTNNGELSLKEKVKIKTDNSQLMSDQVFYETSKDQFTSTGNVKTQSFSKTNNDKIFIDSEKVTSWPQTKRAHYQGKVTGLIKRKRKYEESVYFDSDNLHLDYNLAKILLNGNVSIKKQGIRASSQRGEIFLENYNKKLKYYVLYDDVKVMEKVKAEGNRILDRRAYAEKLEGIISEELIILTGYPKVFQNDDLIKGNKIILRENNEVVEVDDASANFYIE